MTSEASIAGWFLQLIYQLLPLAILSYIVKFSLGSLLRKRQWAREIILLFENIFTCFMFRRNTDDEYINQRENNQIRTYFDDDAFFYNPDVIVSNNVNEQIID